MRKKGKRNWGTIYISHGLDKGTTYYFSVEALGETRRSGMGGEVEVW